MSIEYLLLPLACFGLGVIGAIAGTWTIHGRLYSLEDRQSVMEGSLLREVKSRAATERWKKQSIEEAAIESALQAPPAAEPRKAKWFQQLKNGS